MKLTEGHKSPTSTRDSRTYAVPADNAPELRCPCSEGLSPVAAWKDRYSNKTQTAHYVCYNCEGKYTYQ